ncbi:MAG: DNA-binding protein WhiA [Clostridia bacterium]|nr:DNA-binding protein WhiA [Clostridia bacterium]
MAFLNDIKKEICDTAYKTACCRRMMLFGILSARAFIADDDEIVLRMTDENATELAQKLINEQFGRQAEKVPTLHGGRLHVFRFKSFSAKKFLLDLEPRFLASRPPFACESCATAYLRGIFLVAGRITDPSKKYHLELSLGERSDAFRAFFEREYHLSFKKAVRRTETLLYLKDSSLIEEFMAHIQSNDSVFKFINCKIEKQFRNDVNRRTNCEASNINRAVDASTRILKVLRKMEAADLLSSLPPELEAAARLRLAHPEESLAQLSALASPAISKSGMNHRMKRILAYAEKLNIKI